MTKTCQSCVWRAMPYIAGRNRRALAGKCGLTGRRVTSLMAACSQYRSEQDGVEEQLIKNEARRTGPSLPRRW